MDDAEGSLVASARRSLTSGVALLRHASRLLSNLLRRRGVGRHPTLVWWLLASPALIALLLVAANLVWWPRGRTGVNTADAPLGVVSLLIPARNEALNIEACVRAACALDVFEVVVFDDGSDDDTPAILGSLQTKLPKLRVVRGAGGLPVGWVGKPHACAALAAAARGDSFLFVDADVIVDAGALPRLRALAHDYRADVVTAVPQQQMVTPMEQLVLPLLHLTYLAWLPLPLIWRSNDPRFLAANGQLLWLRRSTLDALGGFAAVRAEIVDDMALCRAAKRAGRRVLFADGSAMATCRMYRSSREVIDGFSKNLHEGVGSVVGTAGVCLLYLTAFVAPALLLPFVDAVALDVAVAAGGLARLLIAWRFRQPLWSALLFPVGAAVVAAIALRSLWWSHRGTIHWKGRSYNARAARVTV